MIGPTDEFAAAAGWLRAARRVVVFSGAGASAESGIPTFRDPDGLWTRFPPEQFATPDGLRAIAERSPRRAAEFVHALLQPIAEAAPNPGHHAAAALQRHARTTVVTQNIDGLHQEAGSRDVKEVHGSVFQITSDRGELLRRITREELRQVVARLAAVLREGALDLASALAAVKPILGIEAGRVYRPSLVLFGEPMAEPDWCEALAATEDCDCLITVGTSGVVYPAAMLPEMATSAGGKVIHIGPEPGFGDVWLRGGAGRLLPELLRAAFDA